ncbi:sensor histidine kinase [Virgisporangium aliadipatigenens]|uniref:sensor histidine kinase n=1 Tax=Virgisporangium aliadipatigenens TaxID=741659 RepID=UPI0019432759|nr:sensor histidine kinase [Virgisporangium aliadipatigenens]
MDRRSVAVDAVCAAGYVGLLVLLRHDDPVAVGLVAATGLPVAVRRVWPVPVLAVVVVASAVAVSYGAVRDPFVAVAFALYAVALTSRWRVWRPAAVAVVLVVATAVGTAPVELSVRWWWSGPGFVVVGLALTTGSWALGGAVREQRATALQFSRELAEQAVVRERLRIARELHDVVAHSIGVITVKAGVVNHVLGDGIPGEAGEALRVIEATGREALAEMKHMLGVLRDDPPEIAGLVRNAEAAGLRVTVRADEVPEPLRPTVYRIVQESLTNAAKHAAPAHCAVTVAATAGEILVEVRDDGTAAAQSTQDGHGLLGIRERAAAHGGTCEAGPMPDGGFRVTVRLPA